MQELASAPPRLRARASLSALALALTFATGCQAPGARAQAPRAPSEASPTLEEVFLIPGLHGQPPRLRSLSSDGALALVDWKGIELDAGGRRRWADDLGPHLLRTAQPEQRLGAETSLRALLEKLEREAHLSAAGMRIVENLEDWKPGRPGPLAWSRSGHRLALAWEGALLILEWNDAGGAERKVLYRESPKSEPTAGAAPSEPRRVPERLGRISGLEFEDDDAHLAVRAGPELFLFPLEGAAAWPLTLEAAEWPTREIEAPLERVELSLDRQRAFSRGARLVGGDREGISPEAQFLELPTGRSVVLEGFASLAAAESVDLSPCGEWVFAFEVDRSKQPPATIVPDYLTPRVSTRETRRELADDTWPPRKAWLWSTRDGKRQAFALPGEPEFSAQVVGWAPAGEPRLVLRRTSSDYRTVETWMWDRHGPKLALVERDERWVGGPGSFVRWTRDGERLLLASESAPLSTTPGRNQLFELDPATGALRQLTEVEGEVSRFVVSASGAVVVCASRADPARRELGVLEPGGLRWLPVPAGVNSAPMVSDDGRWVVFEHEELGVPAELWVAPLDGSAGASRLTSTIPEEYLRHDWILPEKLTVTSADGTTVRAHVHSPRGSSLARPASPRPCVVFIHGAGYLQNVTDSMTEYAVNLMFHSRLAELGYVVADVDYRGSAGYGARFRGDVQFQLGKLELEDIGAVVDELARRGAVDPQRVACYGGSYGGFLTLMALFRQPERWSGGAALRSVTDWRTYHPGYTQPRLGRPSTHPEAYAASSPIDHAQHLADPLLILHGLVDSNVFAQDSIRLIEKLIDLGLDFDAMLYPSQNHAFEDGMHWLDEYRRIERFLVRCLAAR